MKHLLLILLSFASLLFVFADARACTCEDYNGPMCAAYWRADAVFAGQLLSIGPVKKSEDVFGPS